MADPTFDSAASGDILREAPVVTVYTRERWADTWLEQPRLFCTRVRFGSSPQGSSAEFVVDLGAKRTIAAPGVLANAERLSYLLNDYVRVKIQHTEFIEDNATEVADYLAENPGSTSETRGGRTWITPAPEYWYGILTEDGGPRDGAMSRESVTYLAGTQQMKAAGFEYLLDQINVDKAFFSGVTMLGEFATLGTPITFNVQDAFGDHGNRADKISELGCYLFSELLADAEYWTTRTIAEYLVTLFQPVNWDANELIPVSLTVNALAILPTWDRPVVRCDGLTLRQLFDRLFDRRRQLGWQILVDEDTGADPAELKIDVFTFVAEDISLPSGATQDANANLREIDFDNALDVSASLTESVRHQVDQVVVRGARKRSCFSLAHDDETLIKDWLDADENAYENGPDPLPDTTAEQERAVIEYRRRDQFRQVYSYFQVPADWDFEIGSGTGSGATGDGSGGKGSATDGGFVLIHPDLDEETEWIYRPQFRFLRTLFKEISSTASTLGAQDAPLPFAVIETETGEYRFIHELAETAGILDEGAGKGRQWSASLRVRSDCPGIVVKVSGAQQLVLAASDFSEEDETYEQAPCLDWKDMIVTVAAELHTYVEAAYPETDDLEGADYIKRVRVNIGDAGRQDYVAPSTIIDVSDGDLVRHDGGFERDDTEWMADLARYVAGWYGQRRKAFQFRLQQVTDLLVVGELITKVGSGVREEDVNSAVVAVTYDFSQQTTVIDTAFSNLDVPAILDWFSK